MKIVMGFGQLFQISFKFTELNIIFHTVGSIKSILWMINLTDIFEELGLILQKGKFKS